MRRLLRPPRENSFARAFARMLGAVLLLAAAPAGPAGRAFYVPPPLGAGVHGDLIRSRALAGSAALPSAARNALVLYRTTALDGRDVAVSGIVSIPAGAAPAEGWPVITWDHGTTGNGPDCAPSLDVPGGPGDSYLVQADAFLDAFVAHGYAVVQTDYEGIGTPGIHPYLVGDAAARDTLDIVRAARQLDPAIGTRFVVIGHSEGGHAALFTAARAAAWAPELSALGTVALAPASHLRPWIASLVSNSTPQFGFAFAGLLVLGYASVDNTIRLDRLLAPAAAPFEAQLASRCVLGLVQRDSWGGLVPERTFAPNADMAPLFAAIARNEPGGLTIGLPVLVVQGTSDEIVAPITSDLLASELCNHGTELTYATVPDADHIGVLFEALGSVRDWVDARFAGTAPVTNCEHLPRAAP